MRDGKTTLDRHNIIRAVTWSKQHDFVASTIVGATRADQLLDNEVMKKINRVSKTYMYPMG
ncbi:MAG: aryl-alcohol dehydrogenase-like predicted oxidoreductase [Patiriisocius sp.]